MSLFSDLRVLALLRRIAKALEAQNELNRERLRLDYPSSALGDRPKPKHTEISVPSVSEWNKRYREGRENL